MTIALAIMASELQQREWVLSGITWLGFGAASSARSVSGTTAWPVVARGALGQDSPESPRAFRASGQANGGLQFLHTPDSQDGVEVDGFLDAAIAEAGVSQSSEAIRRWCEEQGAVQLDEVADELSSLAAAVGLSSLEVERLQSAILRVIEEESSRRAKQDQDTRNEMAALGASFLRGQVSQSEVAQKWEAVMDRRVSS